LKAVKVIEETPGYDPLEENPLTHNKYEKIMPNRLPREFPDTIRTDCVKSIKELIKNLKNNTQGWIDLSERLRALRDELYLFTRGKEGTRGKTLTKEKQNKRRPHFMEIKSKDRSKKKNHSKSKSKRKQKSKSKRKSKRKSIRVSKIKSRRK